MEDDPIARGIGFDAPGDEAVKRERLVGGARHQRLVDVADEALRRRQGLDVVRVQAVEGAEISEIEPAALGRFRVDVRQVVEVGRQGRLAMHRNRARRRTEDPGARRRDRKRDHKGGAEEGANRPADHGRPSIIGDRRIPNGRRIFGPSRVVGRFYCARRRVEGTKSPLAKLLLECRVEYGKRGADPQRDPRASRHEVASRLADANCEAPIGAILAQGEAQCDFRLTVRKDD